MARRKRKLVIKVGNSIHRGNHLRVTIRELYGKTITVIANVNGHVSTDDNPFLVKYLKNYSHNKYVLSPNEYDIILEKPLGGSNA
ncbi:hypothetical protein VOWphi5012_046 [Vibrio phage phi50-12]|uniref:Uncharacterized protein n=1 Tax=Vibrio phage phi50-12 TaxID=2654972 RepID=A0A5P8PRA7_9CAUD|nr:hypothetical protein KNU82_gp046 [Vibrio phage phi50-12]QFR59830.1 hypothetical protein VOWphi5012_046 [Vibrio phage phi50-12]